MSVSTGPVVDESFDPDDFSSNPSGTRHFTEIVQARLSRRSVLAGGMFAASGVHQGGVRTAPVTSGPPT